LYLQRISTTFPVKSKNGEDETLTSYVKAVDGDRVVSVFGGLFARIKLSPLINILSARSTLHRKGCHEADGLDFGTCLLGTAGPHDLGGVEVRGVVFLEDLSFGHGGLETVRWCGVVVLWCCGVVVLYLEEKDVVLYFGGRGCRGVGICGSFKRTSR
jgi:hypothetical protein